LFISANNGHCIAFDNVSSLPPWLSDALCQIATGGGFATRQLWTDADETLFDARRPVVLNGIEEFVTRGDLASRSLHLRASRADPGIPATPRTGTLGKVRGGTAPHSWRFA